MSVRKPNAYTGPRIVDNTFGAPRPHPLPAPDQEVLPGADPSAYQLREQREQIQLFTKLIRPIMYVHQDLLCVYATPNQGARAGKSGKMKKAEGMLAGVWDIHCPVASHDGEYVGLWIEMKVWDGELSPEQEAWATLMYERGHRLEVCNTSVEAFDVLLDHLGITLADYHDWRETVHDPEALWRSIPDGEQVEL